MKKSNLARSSRRPSNISEQPAGVDRETVLSFLNERFFDLENAGSFGGNKVELVKALRSRFPDLGALAAKKLVQTWAQGTREYNLFRKARRHFPTPRIGVPPVAKFQFHIDLADLQQYKDTNKGYRFVLVLIDCLTRYVRLRPLYTKKPVEVSQVLRAIFQSGFKPRYLQGDAGMEFLGRPTQAMLKEEGVHFFVSDSNYKASMAERVIRTLKERLSRYFRSINLPRWYNILPKMERNLNSSANRSLYGLTPHAVHDDPHLQGMVWDRQFGTEATQSSSRFAPGDWVRIARQRGTFEKGYSTVWSNAVYRIGRIRQGHPPMYVLEDPEDGFATLRGFFNEAELQQVAGPEEIPQEIERVLQVEKLVGGNRRYLVKWKNLPDYQAQWLERKELDVETQKLFKRVYK